MSGDLARRLHVVGAEYSSMLVRAVDEILGMHTFGRRTQALALASRHEVSVGIVCGVG